LSYNSARFPAAPQACGAGRATRARGARRRAGSGRGDGVVLGDALAPRYVGERLTADEGGLKIAGVPFPVIGAPSRSGPGIR